MLEAEGQGGTDRNSPAEAARDHKHLKLESPPVRVQEQWMVLKPEWRHSLASPHSLRASWGLYLESHGDYPGLDECFRD